MASGGGGSGTEGSFYPFPFSGFEGYPTNKCGTVRVWSIPATVLFRNHCCEQGYWWSICTVVLERGEIPSHCRFGRGRRLCPLVCI